MEFFELIEARESCRQYADKEVEAEKITKILEAARLAPSGCNSQPWHFTVITEEGEADKLREMVINGAEDGTSKLNTFVKTAPAFIVVSEEKAKLFPMPEKKYGSQRFAQMDVGQATAYLTLAAADLGLGTCCIGMFCDREVKELINAPQESTVRLVITLGYPADEGKPPRQKDRKDLGEIVAQHHR
ncbi:MAG: nitroreductase family protein [Christensenella sp.]|uniref:nitroreductase family protein n=1 Tax=Christensenella sp. TaxID=1935934 RepID=UPI002B20E550|nr:nitroreductase family protein [Christensenella sp.]MEA5004280.1 nitroreductase family protein [Christensenella sp.]